MQSLFEGWRGFLLAEGRKENAAIAIIKKVNDRFLVKFLTDMATNPTSVYPSILAIDPTPNKKYIEWIARRINDYARKEEDDGYLQAYAKADEAPTEYVPGTAEGGPSSEPFTPERLKYIEKLSQDDRIKAGYITNAERAQRNRDNAKVNITNIYSKISGNLLKYHRYAERGLMDKNIDKYKEIHEWEHEVYKVERDDAERQKMKTIEKGAKETTDYLHDDEDFMLVRPTTEEGSCYYGQGTRWCISATTSRNYFHQYTGEGTAFYFVMFKNLPPGDSYKKMALVYTAGSSEEPNEVFDADDDEVGVEALRDAVEQNVIAGAVKQTLGSEMKKLKGDLRQKYFQERLESVVGMYSQLEDLLDGEMMPAGEEAISARARAPSLPGGLSLDQAKAAKQTWKQLNLVLNKLGLDDESLSVALYEDIEEHITELVDEQYYEVLGASSGHFEENPAGPSAAEFDAIHSKYSEDLAHIYISYDEYDEAKWYWDAGSSIDVTDIHEDLEHADEDAVLNVFHSVLDSHNVYPNEAEIYNSEISIRFSPDYDEQEGLDSFDAFCNRMSEYDTEITKMLGDDLADTIEAFSDAKLIAGMPIKSLKVRFDNLDLENFDIDIEEDELSIYVALPITVPMPDHLYLGLTAGAPEWTTQDRARVGSSEALKAYAQMIKDRNRVHSDVLIEELQTIFDNVFELYVKKFEATLPGLGPGHPVADQETVGFAVPDYNISIYPRTTDPRVGASGLIISYFFDVRIEADDAENEGTIGLIEAFLRTVDNESMIEKIKNRFERIVVDDTIKNIMPNFKKDSPHPTIDPRTGKATLPSDEENPAGALTENKKSLRIFINKIG